MSYNTDNYRKQGGDEEVIGGTIDITGTMKKSGTEITATAVEINLLDGVTATTVEINYLDDDNLTAADLTKLAGVDATASEINNAADISARIEEVTSDATAVTAGVQSVEFNNDVAEAVGATIADATEHQGLFIVKDVSNSNTQNHTLTLTSGTFNGANNVATLDAADEALVVYFDSNGNGTIIENVGTVVLSSSS